jgi:AraC-like DNA-binding protein
MNGNLTPTWPRVRGSSPIVQGAGGTAADPLADLLETARVESVCYGRLHATSPWGLRFEATPHAKFCLVSHGETWAAVDGIEEPLRLSAGDFLLLAPGYRVSLRDAPESPVVDFDENLRERMQDRALRLGGGGRPSTLLCGKFLFSQVYARPLAGLLPPAVHFSARESYAPALRATVELLLMEADSPSPSLPLLNRLADVLFLQAVRAYVETAHPSKPAWLRALADEQIGRSLQSMHADLARPWTVAELAAEAGMSRSAYAQRFKQMLGEAPLEYLTRWRMYRACQMLQQTERKLMDVALAVGYDSDAAFHRAFKRVIGVAPGEFRRRAESNGSAGRLAARA